MTAVLGVVLLAGQLLSGGPVKASQAATPVITPGVRQSLLLAIERDDADLLVEQLSHLPRDRFTVTDREILAELFVESARRGARCDVRVLKALHDLGTHVPIDDWKVWVPDVIGCPGVVEGVMQRASQEERNTFALLVLSGITADFQKLRQRAMPGGGRELTPSESQEAIRQVERLAELFHFVKEGLTLPCRKANPVACQIRSRYLTFQTDLRKHLEQSAHSPDLKALTSRQRVRWLRFLRLTAAPFLKPGFRK